MKLKTKKIPYYLTLILLTLGASLILGLLSFSGMYALTPLIPLAVGTLLLSVGYESEIYLENLKGAFNKLIYKKNFLDITLTRKLLLEKFPDTRAQDCPQFFKDYATQLKNLEAYDQRLEAYKKSNLTEEQKNRKAALIKLRKATKKSLTAMELWYSKQLFEVKNKEQLTDYEQEMQAWINGQTFVDEARSKLKTNRLLAKVALAFSATTGLFMTLGTLYLLAGVPFIAAIPMFILPGILMPMALIAGTAYGLLIYNTITDMIQNDTLRSWYKRLKDDMQTEVSVRNVLFALTAVVLIGLAAALTLCTAGTWWSIARHTPAVLRFIRWIPGAITGIITPIFTGLAAMMFNLENTLETLEIIYDFFNDAKGIMQRKWERFCDYAKGVYDSENFLQLINPFRLLLKVTFLPLRILLFIGHLISIGVTSDRVPRVPVILSAILGMISEGFEDLHYFSEHKDDKRSQEEQDSDPMKVLLQKRLDSKHGHHHTDIPTMVLRLLFSPIFALAIAWDVGASQLNEAPETWASAFDKHTGRETNKLKIEENLPEHEQPSTNWQAHHAVLAVDEYIKDNFSSLLPSGAAHDKTRELKFFRDTIKENMKSENHEIHFTAEKQKQVYAKHRFFGKTNELTRTEKFLEKLPKVVNAA